MYAKVYERLTPQALAQRWAELVRDPNAPDRCELDEYGDIQVSPPPKWQHQEIIRVWTDDVRAQLGGQAGSYGLQLHDGSVRFPDLCWAPDFSVLRKKGGSDPMRAMPPLVIEVASPDDRRKELDAKVRAYIDSSVEEVILVEVSGRIRFFTREGEQAASRFGLQLKLPPETYPLRQGDQH